MVSYNWHCMTFIFMWFDKLYLCSMLNNLFYFILSSEIMENFSVIKSYQSTVK